MLSILSVIYTRKKTFCDFLFTFLFISFFFLKRGLLWKETICSPWEHHCFFVFFCFFFLFFFVFCVCVCVCVFFFFFLEQISFRREAKQFWQSCLPWKYIDSLCNEIFTNNNLEMVATGQTLETRPSLSSPPSPLPPTYRYIGLNYVKELYLKLRSPDRLIITF